MKWKEQTFTYKRFDDFFQKKNVPVIEQHMRFQGCLVSLTPFLANSCDVHPHFEPSNFPGNTIRLDIGPITTLNSGGLLSP
jgi:hypothetical protein